MTEVSADAGADVVRAQLDTDAGARHLGEVSLVDRDSRIATAGIVFHNTLFDENAGCHVAWGQSFPFAVEGGMAMTERASARDAGPEHVGRAHRRGDRRGRHHGDRHRPQRHRRDHPRRRVGAVRVARPRRHRASSAGTSCCACSPSGIEPTLFNRGHNDLFPTVDHVDRRPFRRKYRCIADGRVGRGRRRHRLPAAGRGADHGRARRPGGPLPVHLQPAVFDGAGPGLRPAIRDAAWPLTNDTYGPSKVACEQDVTARYGERATLVRPCKVAGPYDSQDRAHRLGPGRGPRRPDRAGRRPAPADPAGGRPRPGPAGGRPAGRRPGRRVHRGRPADRLRGPDRDLRRGGRHAGRDRAGAAGRRGAAGPAARGVGHPAPGPGARDARDHAAADDRAGRPRMDQAGAIDGGVRRDREGGAPTPTTLSIRAVRP